MLVSYSVGKGAECMDMILCRERKCIVNVSKSNEIILLSQMSSFLFLKKTPTLKEFKFHFLKLKSKHCFKHTRALFL